MQTAVAQLLITVKTFTLDSVVVQSLQSVQLAESPSLPNKQQQTTIQYIILVKQLNQTSLL